MAQFACRLSHQAGAIKIGVDQRWQRAFVGGLTGFGNGVVLSAALDEQAAEENQVNRHDGNGDAKMRSAPGFLFQERALGDERVRIIHNVGRWRWARLFNCFEAMVHFFIAPAFSLNKKRRPNSFFQ